MQDCVDSMRWRRLLQARGLPTARILAARAAPMRARRPAVAIGSLMPLATASVASCRYRAGRGQRVPFPSMSPATGLRPLAPPLLPGKGTHCPRPAAAVVFDRRIPERWQAMGGGYPPTEVKEEGRAQPAPGERARTQTVLRTVCAWRAPGALSPGMEWEGPRHPWHARSSSAADRRQRAPRNASASKRRGRAGHRRMRSSCASS